jgi:hypothetical protein
MFMVGFFSLKDRQASSSLKKEVPVYVASFLNLPLLVWSPAETRQVSWELYPGKLG